MDAEHTLILKRSPISVHGAASDSEVLSQSAGMRGVIGDGYVRSFYATCTACC